MVFHDVADLRCVEPFSVRAGAALHLCRVFGPRGAPARYQHAAGGLQRHVQVLGEVERLLVDGLRPCGAGACVASYAVLLEQPFGRLCCGVLAQRAHRHVAFADSREMDEIGFFSAKQDWLRFAGGLILATGTAERSITHRIRPVGK